MVSKVLAAVALVACTPIPPPVPIAPPPSVQPAAMPPAPIDEASIISRTHDLFDAYDRFDSSSFNALLDKGFVRFGFGRFYDAAFLTKSLDARRDGHDGVHSRTWSNEHVYIGTNQAVFIGEAIETVPARADHPATTSDGWNTVMWVRDGVAWRAAHWQWQPAGIDGEREAWDVTFQTGANFKLTANQTLIDAVKGRKTGTALDVGMGQGRNAVYLATQGWKVTGVDLSGEGIRQAKEAATKQKVKLDTVQSDIDAYDLGTSKWDLVTLIYAGDDPKLLDRIKAAVKPHGLFVVEFFAKDAMAGTGIGGFEPGELAGKFSGWKITRDETVEDIADWGLRKAKLVRFVAEKP